MARLNADEIRLGVKEIVAHFSELEDPRSTIKQRHPLVRVVVISITAYWLGRMGQHSSASMAPVTKFPCWRDPSGSSAEIKSGTGVSAR